MKLIIDKELVYFDDSVVDENEISLYDYIFDFLNECSIPYKKEFDRNGLKITILEQKICLDEWKMNDFFCEVLTYFDYEIQYVELGIGVDFTLEIY